MAEVLLLCMRDDEEAAAILADLFYRAGFQTAGGAARPDELDQCAVALVCWSGASQRSTQMREAADRAAQSGKAMIARLDGHPLPPSLWRLPAFDISQWSFAPEDPVLDGLYVAVERAVTRSRDAISRLGRISQVAEPPAAPRGQTVSDVDLEAEAAFWRRIQASADPADFLTYLDRFGPKGAFAELALMRIERLGGAAQPAAAPAPAARAPAKAEPQPAPTAPAWTGWSVQPGSVRPPRYTDSGQDSIDDRLDRRQLEPRRGPDPGMRRPEPPRPETYARDFAPEPHPRHDQPRPTPPRLDPVAPDARRAEPRRSDPRYLPPPAPDDAPIQYRPPAVRRPHYDDEDRRGAPPVAQASGRADRTEGGGRGFVVVLVAVAALAGAGFAMRGMIPASGGKDVADRPETALASTAQEVVRGAEIPIAAAESGLTPPPRGEAVSLDSIVTETAPTSSITPASRDRRQPASAPPVRYANAIPRNAAATTGVDLNAAYAPPPSATLPPAEPPASVAPAPMPVVAAPAQSQTASSGASADAPVRPAARVRWTSKPTSNRLEQLYPARARQAEVDGQATLRCTVLPDARAACSVLYEAPLGYGFGTAALRAADSLRAASSLDDGSNATGAISDVIIRFKVQ